MVCLQNPTVPCSSNLISKLISLERKLRLLTLTEQQQFKDKFSGTWANQNSELLEGTKIRNLLRKHVINFTRFNLRTLPFSVGLVVVDTAKQPATDKFQMERLGNKLK